MGKIYCDVVNTTIKVLKEMGDATVKAAAEQMIRLQSYMIESQSAPKAAGWTEEDGDHVIKNLKALKQMLDTNVDVMIKVTQDASGMQVDGDQLAIDGYKLSGVSPDTQ